MSTKAKKAFGLFKKHKAELTELASNPEMQDIIKDVKAVKPDDVMKTIDTAAQKLDQLAEKETADGSVSQGVVGWFSSKTAKPEPKKSSMKNKVVSMAIKNWRYSIPFLCKFSIWTDNATYIACMLVYGASPTAGACQAQS